MKVGLSLLVLLLVPALVLGGAYLAFPAISPDLGRWLARDRGVEIDQLVVARPGADRLLVHRFEARAGRLTVIARDGEIRYSVAHLLDGRLEQITFAEVALRIEADGTADDAAETTPAPDVGALFALLPFDRLELPALSLEMPEVGFVGEGSVELDPGGARLYLAGLEPDEAKGVTLKAELESSGGVSARFSEQRPDAVPFLTLASRLGGDRLDVTGTVNLSGYPLALVSALAGVPAGEGALEAQFATGLRWPPEVAELAALEATGSYRLDWRAETLGVGLEQLAGDFTVAGEDVQTRFSGGVVKFADGDLEASAVIPAGLALSLKERRVVASEGVVAHVASDAFSADATLGAVNVSLAEPLELTGTAEVTAKAAGFETGGRLGIDLDYAQPTVSGAGALTIGPHKIPLSVRYDTQTQRGSLESAGALSVNKPLGAALVRDWRAPYDLDKGNVTYRLDLAWQSGRAPHGELRLTLDKVLARYEEDQVDGVAGNVTVGLTEDGVVVRPARLTAERTDPGVPLTDLTARVGYRDDVVSVAGAAFSVLGGRAELDDFDYDVATGSADVMVRFVGVKLADALALQGSDIGGVGLIDGELPIHLSGGQASIAGGQIRAQPPGGTLKLAPSFGTATGQPGIDFALEALTDYRFTSLEASVNYGEDGELVLGVALKGRNPKVEKGRPIHYNLNVTQNLRPLLTALRAERTVSENLERKVTR